MGVVEVVTDPNFFDSNLRNTAIAKMVKNIGGLTFIKARSYKHPKPFIYNEDRTQYKVHVDSNTKEIVGLTEFIESLTTDSSADNYLISLAPVLIESEGYEKGPFSLFIVDLDVGHKDDTNGIETFKLKYKNQFGFKNTLTVKTKSGGLHLYYYIETEQVQKIGFNKKIDFDKGIDLLSSQGLGGQHYIIGSGSQGYGKALARLSYSPPNDVKIAKLPTLFLEFLIETYAKLNQEVLDAKAAVEATSKLRIKEDEAQNLAIAENYVNKVIAEALQLRNESSTDPFANTRNDALNGYAYRLSSFGLSLGTIKKNLQKINSLAFVDPLDDYSFDKTAESAYAARLRKGETSANAEIKIPKFPPYSHLNDDGDQVISYNEVIKRLDAIPRGIRTVDMVQTTDGVALFSDLVFYVEGNPVIVTKKRTESIFTSVEKLLSTDDKLTFADIRAELRKIELSFVAIKNDALFNRHVGPCPGPKKEGPGRPTSTITKHPLFEARVTKGLSKAFVRPKSNNLVEGNLFYQVAPPPITEFPPLSQSELSSAKPIIEKVIEHFKLTLTNPDYPEETEFLINRIAAMIQRKAVPNFIVFYGPGGTGKSTFLQFLSLFFASSDELIASNFDQITSRFARPGELTTVDDCDLSKAREWDIIKQLITADVISVEEKGGAVSQLQKNINMFLCTNRKIPQLEKLTDRRMLLLQGHPVYTGPQYLDKLNELTRDLLNNNLLGLRAFYHYLLNYKITVQDWGFTSEAQKDMVSEMRSEITGIDNTVPSIASARLVAKTNSRRERFRKPVFNMIANMGFVAESVHPNARLALCSITCEQSDTGLNRNEHPFVRTSYDIGFMLQYFNKLSANELYEINQYLTWATRDKLSNLTTSLIKRTTPFAEVTGKLLASAANKKSVPLVNGDIQQRRCVPSPISFWLDRVCFLVGDSLSTKVSEDEIVSLGLSDIAIFIRKCEEEEYEPSREECQVILEKSFPGAELGKFDISDRFHINNENDFDDGDETNW